MKKVFLLACLVMFSLFILTPPAARANEVWTWSTSTSSTVVDPTSFWSRQVTRGQYVSMLVNLLQLPRPEEPLVLFNDVSSENRYADAIAVAAEAGLVVGYPDGTFRPDQVISREELAIILSRIAPPEDVQLVMSEQFSNEDEKVTLYKAIYVTVYVLRERL